MPTLIVHPDVRAHLAKLDVSIRDFIRQKVLWAETQLAMTGRSSRVKGTRGQAWRRTPVRGNQYYLWWAPADEVGVASPDLGPTIAVRDVRPHDELTPPAPASRADYDVVHPRELDPRSALQASVVCGAPSSGIAATIVRGQPGTGKTLSLLYAARDLAASQRVLYVTYTPQLVEDALTFAKAAGIGDSVVVMTLEALEVAILRDHGALVESPSGLAQRFDAMVRSLDSSQVGAWSNKGQALWAEARASLVGMALPFAWKRGALTVPPCEILDLAIYRDISGLDEDAAEKARHIADIARRRGLLADQTRARAALDALMNGNAGDLPIDGVRAVLLDEAQDLTPIEMALLLELPRAIARHERAALFIAAGDESQTVHPSGFEWGIAKDLIRERLGREPKDIVLGHAMRSPDAILSIINKSGTLYKALPKNFRPGGAVAHNAPPSDNAGRVLQCNVPVQGGYEGLVEAALVMNPGRALVKLDNSPVVGKDAHAAGAAVTFTPAEIKGLERRIVVVTGLDDTLGTLNRLTTRSAHESRSLESLEARYLIDGVRVALSRATETLVLLRRDSNTEGMGGALMDLVGSADAIEWEDLLCFLRENDLSEEERAYGFLEEAREHEGRGDARRAIERVERAEAVARGLSDAELSASIRELRERVERKAGLRIVVAEAGGGDFTSLQEAIDSAPEGASIHVRPGTYRGPFFVEKNMKIIGDGPRGSVVLEGDMGVVAVHSCEVTLEGLGIQRRRFEDTRRPKFGGLFKKAGRFIAKSFGLDPTEDVLAGAVEMVDSNRVGVAVGAHDCKLDIRDCDVNSEGGPGIVGAMSAHVRIDGCTVQHTATGIFAGPGSFMTIERSEVRDCARGIASSAGARLVVRGSSVCNIGECGIWLTSGSEARVENNDIHGVKHLAIVVASDVIAMVLANRIHQCYGGIRIEENGGGVFEENDIAECEHVGFWVTAGADPTVRGNRIRNGKKYGVFIDLKGGGTYEKNQIVGNADVALDMSGEGRIVVRGTLIQGNGTGFCGVFIGRGMVGVFEDNDVSDTQSEGAAVHVEAGADFIVRKNRIHHNSRQGIVSRGLDCVIEDNEIFECGDVGLAVEEGGSSMVRGNRIHSNPIGIVVRSGASGLIEDNDVYTQRDSNIFVDGANGIFRKNRIRRAWRFGLLITGPSEPLFEGNDISESGASPAGGNVAVHNGARPVLRDNTIHGGELGVVFYGNALGVAEGNDIASSLRVGVCVKDGSTPIVRGNRIHETKGFGVIVQVAGGTIENNEIYRNRGIGIRTESAGVVVRGNRVHDNVGGGVALQPKTTGVFERNQILANKQWGFMVGDGADPTVCDNQIQGSPVGMVLCREARGTYVGNDVRGNAKAGLLLDSRATPARCEGNISERAPVVGSANMLNASKGSTQGHGRKKGRGR